MNRFHQCVLIGSTILGSWLGMQAVHELGHVVGAVLTGGRVERVVLSPLTISRTDVAHSPHPLAVVWAGPIVGVVLPLAFWGVAAAFHARGAYMLRFFAGFCLVANGIYIGMGSFERIGDCGEMLRSGSALWHSWLFGLATVPLGFWLWHRQGVHFGLRPARKPVDLVVAYVTFAVFIALLVLGFAVGGE